MCCEGLSATFGVVGLAEAVPFLRLPKSDFRMMSSESFSRVRAVRITVSGVLGREVVGRCTLAEAPCDLGVGLTCDVERECPKNEWRVRSAWSSELLERGVPVEEPDSFEADDELEVMVDTTAAALRKLAMNGIVPHDGQSQNNGTTRWYGKLTINREVGLGRKR